MKELFTGKNKNQFEKWYINDFLKVNEDEINNFLLEEFYALNLAFQKGVIEAYYDSLGLYVGTDKFLNHNKFINHTWVLMQEKENKSIGSKCYYVIGDGYEITRNEAYTEAFIKANSLENNKL